MKKLSHLSNFYRVLFVGALLVMVAVAVPAAFAQTSDPSFVLQAATGTPGTPTVEPTALTTSTPVPTAVATASATPGPSVSATEPFHYSFTSRSNECGWGSFDGQVLFGKLYVSPGFNLTKWLAYNPSVTFERLSELNPGLRGGVQFDCGAIVLPSM